VAKPEAKREFIRLVGGATAAWPFVARAEQPMMPIIGLIAVLRAANSVSFASMKKHFLVAIAVSITCLFAVMLWAQAGRFETKGTGDRPQSKSSSFRSPYWPMPFQPIYY
jgi:hypothetical protein